MSLSWEQLQALLLLSGLKFTKIEKVPNEYWIGARRLDIAAANPWFRVGTAEGAIVIGTRKRVIEINWSDTKIRGTFCKHERNTQTEEFAHAWTYVEALEILAALSRELWNREAR